MLLWKRPPTLIGRTDDECNFKIYCLHHAFKWDLTAKICLLLIFVLNPDLKNFYFVEDILNQC